MSPRRLSYLLLSGAFTAIGLTSEQVVAQVTTTYKSQDEQPKTVVEVAPDVTGLWYHINKQQRNLANQEAARLTRTYPNWTMSDELVAALDKLNNPPKTKLKGASKPAKDAPLAAFSAWSEGKRAAISEARFSQLSQLADNLARNDYHLLMGWTALNKAWLEKAEHHFTRAGQLAANRAEKQSADEGLSILQQVKINHAIAGNDIEQIAAWLAADNRPQVLTLVDAQGWKDYDKGNYIQAQQWFALTGNQEGRWLSLQQSGNSEAAARFACEQDNNEIFLRRCANYYAEQQASFYQQGELEQSIKAGLALKQIRSLREEEHALLGWAASEAGQDGLAIQAFTHALTLAPNNQDIAGQLVRLYQRNDKPLEPLMRANSQVRANVNALRTAKAWPRKQFMYSYLSGDPRAVTAQSKTAWNIVAGATTKQRSGEIGLGNFDMLSSYVGVGSTVARWRWQVALDYQQLYSGTPASNSWFASGQIAAPFAGITGLEDTGIRGEVELQTDNVNFYGNLAYSLIDQPVAASVTGQLSASWFLADTTIATSAFRLPKQDSLLSYSGTFNADHNDAWGYVIGEGVSALVAYSVRPQVSLSATIKWEQLQGERVDDNHALSLRSDVSVNIAPSVSERLDYWRVGPYLSYLGYDKNLSGFTYGHGGYFSPDYLVSLGVYSELLTQEAHHWQVKLSSSLGVSRLSETDNLRFPLSTDTSQQSLRVPSNTSTGISGDVMLEGQYRVSEHWLVAAYVGRSFAVQYQAFEAGIQLRWRPGKGDGVTSDELLRSSPRLSGFAL